MKAQYELRFSNIINYLPPYKRVAIITDENVFKLYGRHLASNLTSKGCEVTVLTIAPGEKSKSLLTATKLYQALANNKFPRTGAILALGGGVIGDLTGFIAATYMRGTNLIHLPTTLMAMVDSSIGGKNGVNLAQGKNLVGSFYGPETIATYLSTLQTLPAKEFSTGMAEVIKYGAISSPRLLRLVQPGLSIKHPALLNTIRQCISIKEKIVMQDPYEENGYREVLNFGHTIGHALETVTEYKAYTHGQAIAIGMHAAALLSQRELGLTKSSVALIKSALVNNGLPITLPKSRRLITKVLDRIGQDKKVTESGLNWVLLKKLGQATTGNKIKVEVVETVLKEIQLR